MNRFRKTTAIVSLVALISIPAAGCGSSNGGSGEAAPDNNLVPNYHEPIQKAQDASAIATQKQKEIEESVKRVEEGP